MKTTDWSYYSMTDEDRQIQSAMIARWLVKREHDVLRRPMPQRVADRVFNNYYDAKNI